MYETSWIVRPLSNLYNAEDGRRRCSVTLPTAISKFNLSGEKGEKYSTVTANQLIEETMKALNNMEKTYSCRKSISLDKTIQYSHVLCNSEERQKRCRSVRFDAFPFSVKSYSIAIASFFRDTSWKNIFTNSVISPFVLIWNFSLKEI